ncbi:MAG: hypothetical protein HZC15_05665 [Candidatus Omnitrophica bacterium]|nr:hypothetical protein [Candidatus Omnitrophota bacterium]
MDNLKPKSVKSLEEKMENMDADSLRYHIMNSAKNFKTSWVELGRSLYSVYKDKLFKNWGYSTFDIYSAKEIGIRKQTAMKLLRSYYFLEKEEPAILKEDYKENAQPATLPSYESIDVLRQAKNKKALDAEDYASLKKEIFEKGRDARDAKRDLTTLIRQRQELDPDEAFEKKRLAAVRRFLGTLKAIKQEIESHKLVSASIIKEAASLIQKLEAELG